MVNGPDLVDGMIDEVFPSAGDATSDQLQTQPMANTHLVPGCVPGSENLPSRMLNGSTTRKNAFGDTVTYGARTRSQRSAISL